MRTAIKVNPVQHKLYIEFEMFDDTGKIGSIDIDIPTILNSRGVNYKELFVGKTLQQAQEIADMPMENLKHLKEEYDG